MSEFRIFAFPEYLFTLHNMTAQKRLLCKLFFSFCVRKTSFLDMTVWTVLSHTGMSEWVCEALSHGDTIISILFYSINSVHFSIQTNSPVGVIVLLAVICRSVYCTANHSGGVSRRVCFVQFVKLFIVGKQIWKSDNRKNATVVHLDHLSIYHDVFIMVWFSKCLLFTWYCTT